MIVTKVYNFNFYDYKYSDQKISIITQFVSDHLYNFD